MSYSEKKYLAAGMVMGLALGLMMALFIAIEPHLFGALAH